MASNDGLSRDKILQVSEFIEQALSLTHDRLGALGLDADALLDPEESIDQQVAVLRNLYLEAEKSALPFDSRDSNFWRVLRARLQPVVLAYLAHEKFVQTLDKDALELRPDLLKDVYRDRLNNSDRFREFFFELNEKLKQESHKIEELAVQAKKPASIVVTPQYKMANDSAAIQNNVLKMLEKQLRDLEKEFNKKEQALVKSGEDVLRLKNAGLARDDEIARLNKANQQLEEETIRLKLALDATGQGNNDDFVLETEQDADAGANPFHLNIPRDSDREQLLLKIDALERELSTTSDAAYNAFMSSSDLGIVILFMLTSFRCQTVAQLGQEMVRSISTFGLKALTGVRSDGDYHYAASSGADISLQTVLEQNRGKGALFENKYLLRYEASCCVLIQDPPVHDQDRYGRIKDNLGTLLRVAEARHVAIEAAQSVQRQKVQVEQLILRSSDVLSNFEKNLAKQHDRVARQINLFAQELRRNLGIPAGDQKSIRLNMDLKKLEDALHELFIVTELLDPAFVKNINRVAAGIQTKQKAAES